MQNNFFKIGKLSGKGATAVICFCLAAVAAIGVYSYRKSADELNKELSSEQGSTSAVSEAQSAGVNAGNVPIEDVYGNADVILDEDGLSGGAQAANTPAESSPGDNETLDITDEAPGSDADMSDAGITDAIVAPLSGEVIQDYSDGELVKSRTLGVWKTHDGIDIAGDTGESVRSMTTGTVLSVTKDTLMGVTVIIDHGSGYEGYYCNLADEVNVSEGDTVSAGTVIGAVGSTAEAEISEAPHLHFAIKENGTWTDPTELLSGIGS